MTQLTKNQRRRAAANQAAHWLVALQAGDLSSQQNAEFIDWLRESQLHVSEMLHACRLHRDLNAFDRWSRISSVRESAEDKVVLLMRSERLRPSVVTRRRVSPGFAVAASFVVALLVGVLMAGRFGQSTWRTESGERREVTLTDGSVISLAPGSEVHARIGRNIRAITLSRGEALFHVAKDASRPFVVQVAGTQVRAVGTVFNVAQSDRAISVTVVEGKVAVSGSDVTAPANTSEHVVPLIENQQIVISKLDHSSAVHPVRGDLEVAWAAGQLVFENETVADIVRRFNQYNKIQIRLADERLAQRRMGGMFRATDPESFVAVLQSAGGVALSRPSDGVIVIGSNDGDAEIHPSH